MREIYLGYAIIKGCGRYGYIDNQKIQLSYMLPPHPKQMEASRLHGLRPITTILQFESADKNKS